MVSFVHRRAGENVTDGEPLVTVQALQAERIVGYLRQPFPFEPEIGMKVEIKTRALKPQVASSEIQHVGAQLEPITNALSIVRPGKLADFGLPVVVSLPSGFLLRPGEVVDLTLSTREELPLAAASNR